jgi:hypothetical protein
MSDRMTQLTEAGFAVNAASDSQRAVVESLTEEEIGVLLSVRQRIEAATPDVEGHAQESTSGGWFW